MKGNDVDTKNSQRRRGLYAAILASVVACGCSGPDAAKALSNASRPMPVKVVAAIKVNRPITVPILGAITAESRANIGAEADGRVIALLAHEGEHVTAGQALIQLAGDDAQTRVSAAKGGLQQAILSAQADEQIASAKLLQAKMDYGQTKDRLTSAVTLAESKQIEAQAHYDELKRGPRPQEIEAANSDVVAAQSVVESDQTTVDYAKLILKRKSSLLAQGGISQNDVDQAQLDYDHSVQSVQFAQQQLRAKQLYLNLLKEGTPKEELAQGAAQLAAAKESLRAAKTNLASLDDAKQAVAMAQADYDRASFRLKQLQSGSLSDEAAKVLLAQQDLARTQIKSPIDGVVTSLKVVKGQVARAGQIVAEVVGRGGVQMEATAMDQDVAKIHAGEKVHITLRDAHSQEFEGAVQQVLPPGSEGRSWRIIVSVADAGSLAPGSVVNGEVETTESKSVLQVPASVLLNVLDNEADVYVVSKGRLEKRPIQFLSKDSESAFFASGLNAGDQVVIRPTDKMHDGLPVTVETGLGAHR